MINYDKYKGHTKGPLEAIFHENGDIDICCKEEPWIKIAQMHESLDVDVSANADLLADAPLILQRCMELEDVLTKLVFLHTCEMEGIASGQPTLKEWEDAIELASQALSKQREGE